jgi:hypothetical protein
MSVPQALDTGNVTLGVLPVSSEARDPYGYEGYRVAGERSVSKTAYAGHKSIPDKFLGT